MSARLTIKVALNDPRLRDIIHDTDEGLLALVDPQTLNYRDRKTVAKFYARNINRQATFLKARSSKNGSQIFIFQVPE